MAANGMAAYRGSAATRSGLPDFKISAGVGLAHLDLGTHSLTEQRIATDRPALPWVN